MLQLERQKQILKIMTERKSMTVKELCAEIYASPATVRRDLKELEKEGYITRSFGGAVLNGVFPNQVPSSVREKEDAAEKKKLSAKAASLVRSGETVFIDGSTTTFYMAQYLKDIPDITVITNNPKLCLKLAEYGVRSFCTGGEMLNESMVFAGTQAEEYVRGIRAHKFFFSARGADKRVITDSCIYQRNIKRAMLECADESIFLCGKNKFEKTYSYVVTDIDKITKIKFE